MTTKNQTCGRVQPGLGAIAQNVTELGEVASLASSVPERVGCQFPSSVPGLPGTGTPAKDRVWVHNPTHSLLVSRSQSGASPGTPVRQSGKFFSPAGQPTNPIQRNFQSGGVSAPVRHRAKKTAPSTIQVTSASPADGPIRRLGALGPWDPGTMGPWDPGTLGPWDPGTLGPWDLGTLGPWDPGTLGPGTLGPVSYTHLTLPTICSV